MINIAVMGYGTVGSGVVEVIDTNGERIAQRIGDALNVKYVLDIRDFPETRYRKNNSMILRQLSLMMRSRSLWKSWEESSQRIPL